MPHGYDLDPVRYNLSNRLQKGKAYFIGTIDVTPFRLRVLDLVRYKLDMWIRFPEQLFEYNLQ